MPAQVVCPACVSSMTKGKLSRNELKQEQEQQKDDIAAPQPAYVSVAEAASLLGIHRSAIYQAIRAGQLCAVRVMGKKALHRADLLEYIPRPYKGRNFTGDE